MSKKRTEGMKMKAGKHWWISWNVLVGSNTRQKQCYDVSHGIRGNDFQLVFRVVEMPTLSQMWPSNIEI